MRFLLVDEIVDLDPGKWVKAKTFISPEEEYFQDHFPGFPVVPGVLLTEMMGQAAAKCLEAESNGRGKTTLAKITSAVFRDWVRPGKTVDLYAEIKANRETFATTACQGSVDGKVVCSAELLFSYLKSDALSESYRDPVLEAFYKKRSR
jgi:3-hydroxyacyl-[acyl-carrier-protein] dehydratase